MGSKKLLFFGIFVLILGILLRKLSSLETTGLVMIILGVSCKTMYIVAKVRSGEYRPGTELLFLGVGLLLFLSGLFLRKYDPSQSHSYPVYMIATGLFLKVIFIVKFIQLTKKKLPTS